MHKFKQNQCTICLEPYYPKVYLTNVPKRYKHMYKMEQKKHYQKGLETLTCNHVFHHKCIYDWFINQINNGQIESCPVCKATINKFDSKKIEKSFFPYSIINYCNIDYELIKLIFVLVLSIASYLLELYPVYICNTNIYYICSSLTVIISSLIMFRTSIKDTYFNIYLKELAPVSFTLLCMMYHILQIYPVYAYNINLLHIPKFLIILVLIDMIFAEIKKYMGKRNSFPLINSNYYHFQINQITQISHIRIFREHIHENID